MRGSRVGGSGSVLVLVFVLVLVVVRVLDSLGPSEYEYVHEYAHDYEDVHEYDLGLLPPTPPHDRIQPVRQQPVRVGRGGALQST